MPTGLDHQSMPTDLDHQSMPTSLGYESIPTGLDHQALPISLYYEALHEIKELSKLKSSGHLFWECGGCGGLVILKIRTFILILVLVLYNEITTVHGGSKNVLKIEISREQLLLKSPDRCVVFFVFIERR